MMLRKTLTFFSLIGIVLSLVLWGVSYYNIVYVPSTRTHRLDLQGGILRIQWVIDATAEDFQSLSDAKTQSLEAYPPGTQRRTYYVADGKVNDKMFFTPGFEIVGFGTFHTYWRIPRYNSFAKLSMIEVPLYFPLLIFTGTLIYLHLPFHLRRIRKRLGLCVKCGYDLRGQVEPRCPECGTPFEKREEKIEKGK